MPRLVFCLCVFVWSAHGATNYDAGDHSRREEVDQNGNIRGQYSYLDSNGKTISVRYSAGKNGFQVENAAPVATPSPAAYATTPAPPSAPQYFEYNQLPSHFQQQQQPRAYNSQYQPIPYDTQPPRTPAPRNYAVFENQQPTPTDQVNNQQRFFPVPAGYNFPADFGSPTAAAPVAPSQYFTAGSPQFKPNAAPAPAPQENQPIGQQLFQPSLGSERAASARQLEQYLEEIRNETSASPQVSQPNPASFNPFGPQQFPATTTQTPEQRQPISPEQLQQQYRFLPPQSPALQQFQQNPEVHTSVQEEPPSQHRFLFLPPGLINSATTPRPLSFNYPTTPQA